MPVGSIVNAFGGVQEYTIAEIATLNPTVPDVPLTWNLSIFSMVIGHTAWIGTNICAPKPGDTFVVRAIKTPCLRFVRFHTVFFKRWFAHSPHSPVFGFPLKNGS